MTTPAQNKHRRRTDELDFRLIYLGTMPLFVLVATLGRLWPARGREAGPSILDEARAAAKTCGSLALLG